MSIRLHAQHLADFARRAAIAVRDDIGRHRRAVPAVLLVHVLDDAFAPVAARQIEIDVRPLAALFRQEALEEQFHAHRVDGRDPEAVAHGAVGRRSAPLRENPLPAAEIDDVPDNQEVTGEFEFLDEGEFALDLGAGAIVERPVALARAHQRDGAQERVCCLAGRYRVVGEAVAEIRHRILDAIRQFHRGRERRRVILEERRHLGRRLQVALRVRRQPPPRLHDRRLVADAGEYIEERPLHWVREPDAVRGNERHVKGRREIAQHAVGGFLLAEEVALQFQPHVVAAEHADQPVHQAAHAVPAGHERLSADNGDEAAGAAVKLVEVQRALAFRRAQFHARQQAAEVLVPLAAFHKNREPPCPGLGIGDWGLGARPFDSRTDAPLAQGARRESPLASRLSPLAFWISTGY